MRDAAIVLAFLATAAGAASAVDSWDADINLSQTPTDSETGLGHHPMAVTADGVLHAVWAEKDGPNQNYRIYTRCLEQGAWTPAELVVDYLATDPGTNGGAKYPALAAPPDGSLHLFWHDYRVAGINNVEIYTKSRPAGGNWDPAHAADVRLTTTNHPETNGDNGYVPVPVAAADGALHVAWYDFRYDGQHAEILSKSRPAGGAWDLTPGDGPDVNVSNDGDGSELVALGIDGSGDVHAAWRSVGSGAVLYSRRDAGTGIWSAPVPVDTLAVASGAPALAVEPAGRVHVVWPDGRRGGRALWTSVREPSGTWVHSADPLTPPAHAADEPSLAAADDGTLHLVWQDGRASLFAPEVFHREKAPGAAWDTTSANDFPVSGPLHTATRPSVLVHGSEIFVLWRDGRTPGNSEIRFRRGGPAGTGASPAATLPAAAAALRAFPNPTRGPVRFARSDGARPGPLEIVDATGRLVRRLPTGAVWDGRSSDGAPVPAGVYFVRAGDDGALRITVLR